MPTFEDHEGLIELRTDLTKKSLDMQMQSPESTCIDSQNARAMRVLGQFRQVFGAVRAHFHKLEKQTGVSGTQAWALSLIRDESGLGVNDLAARLNVRQPTASNLVKTLVKAGLVEISRKMTDKRNVQLTITAAGLLAIDRAPGPVNGVLPHALAALEPEDLVQLESQLAVLVVKLGAGERSAQVPLSDLVRR